MIASETSPLLVGLLGEVGGGRGDRGSGGTEDNVISLHVTVRISVYQKQIFIHFILCQSLSHVEHALPVKTEA